MTKTPSPLPSAAGVVEPCPFACTGQIEVTFSHELGRWDIYEVECSQCGTSRSGPSGFEGEAAKEAAIAAWNTRHRACTAAPSLDALRALSDEATDGPWQHLVEDDDEFLAIIQADAAKVPDRVAGIIFSRAVKGAEGHGVTLATINARRSTIEQDDANAAFIVACVNHVRTALAESAAFQAAESGKGVGDA